MGDEDVDAKRSRPSIGKPAMCHARKERVLLIGTDQRITSGPAARTAASRGWIHGCTRIVSRKVRFFSLAPRAPSIHGAKCECRIVPVYDWSRMSSGLALRGRCMSPQLADIVAKVPNCRMLIFPPQDNPTRDRRST